MTYPTLTLRVSVGFPYELLRPYKVWTKFPSIQYERAFNASEEQTCHLSPMKAYSGCDRFFIFVTTEAIPCERLHSAMVAQSAVVLSRRLRQRQRQVSKCSSLMQQFWREATTEGLAIGFQGKSSGRELKLRGNSILGASDRDSQKT